MDINNLTIVNGKVEVGNKTVSVRCYFPSNISALQSSLHPRHHHPTLHQPEVSGGWGPDWSVRDSTSIHYLMAQTRRQGQSRTRPTRAHQKRRVEYQHAPLLVDYSWAALGSPDLWPYGYSTAPCPLGNLGDKWMEGKPLVIGSQSGGQGLVLDHSRFRKVWTSR